MSQVEKLEFTEPTLTEEASLLNITLVSGPSGPPGAPTTHHSRHRHN